MENLLKKYNIPVVLHIMLGLPNETKTDLLNTINFVNNLDIWGIKIHSTYVITDTALHDLYLENKYSPLSLDEYIEQACYVLTHIKKEVKKKPPKWFIIYSLFEGKTQTF